jgi:hypothetical protein
MKAFIIKRYGKKEKLHLVEIVEPVVNEKECIGANTFGRRKPVRF